MSMSFYSPPLATNVIYDGAYTGLSPASIASGSSKYMKCESGILQFSNTKNTPNGPIELNSLGLIDSNLLPSFVNDVLEYADFISFPATGEQGIIYIDLSTSFQYRWSGSSYFNVSTAGFYTKSEITNYLSDKASLSLQNIFNGINVFNANTRIDSLFSYILKDRIGSAHMRFENDTVYLEKDLNMNGKQLIGSSANFTNIYTKSESDTLLNAKLNITDSTTLFNAKLNITDANNLLNGKFDKTGGTISGAVNLNGNLQFTSQVIGGVSLIYAIGVATTEIKSTAGFNYLLIQNDLIECLKPLSATDIGCDNTNTNTIRTRAGILHMALSPTVLTMHKHIDMNGYNITGCNNLITGSITSPLGRPILMTTQALDTFSPGPFLSGQLIRSITLPIGTTFQHIISCWVTICDNFPTVLSWESIPEFGFVNSLTLQNYFTRYNETTRIFEVIFNQIENFGHFNDTTGLISIKITYNAT